MLIDEVGDLSPEAQIRLLRFLDRGEVARFGSNEVKRVKVRIIAATLKNLEVEVEHGRFRRDLLYRLRGIQIQLPALRDRCGAFDDVVRELLERVRPAIQPQLTHSARAALRAYGWPGNLRELRQVLNGAIASAEDETVQLEDLPGHVRRNYWDIPFEQRAADFLCDATRSQPLSADIVTHRANTVRAYLDSLPAPESVSKQFAVFLQVQDFLDDIPDDSRLHQESRRNLQRLIERGNEYVRITHVVKDWQDIAAADLSTLAREGVVRELARAGAMAESAGREMREAVARFNLDENPWWTLWNEIRSLPILRGIEAKEELQVVYGIAIRFMMSMPEAVRARVQSAIHERRGLRGVWDAIKDIAQDHVPDEPIEYQVVDSSAEVAPAAHIRPREQTPEFWQHVAESCVTLADTRKLSGYDPKTIKQYLGKHGLRLSGATDGDFMG